jgi:pimeloyl-ACP methyl ester carboxylesterase
MGTFVLVHGFACDHRDWRHQIDHLQKGHMVLSPGLRAHGPQLEVPAKVNKLLSALV